MSISENKQSRWRHGHLTPKQNCFLLSFELSVVSKTVATCVNYADLNNSVLRMRGHVSAGICLL